MIFASKIRFVILTCPDRETSDRLARLALQERLVACVNIIPSCASMYLWKDEIIEEQECVLLAKTIEGNLDDLETKWISSHPYEVPEFIVLEAEMANRKYEEWVEECFQR